MTRYNRRAILGLGVMSAAGLVPLPRAMGRAQPQAPDVSFVVGSRSAAATPVRSGCTHTGGGNIDVQQPALDTLVVTMSGVAVAYGGPTGPASAGLGFEMVQQFGVSSDKPTVRAARLPVEGRVIGFLRSHKVGSAEQCAGVVVSGPGGGLLALAMPAHAVSGCESISINDKEGPAGVV